MIKTHFKAMAAVLLAACSVLSVPASAGTTVPHVVEKAYYQYREANNVTQYRMADLDRDGVQDMIFRKGKGIGVCTWNPDKIRVVRTAWAPTTGTSPRKVWYRPSAHKFAWCVTNEYGGEYRVYKLDGNAVSSVQTLSWKNHKAGGPYYMINGKKVSRSKFDKKVHAIWKYKTVSFK